MSRIQHALEDLGLTKGEVQVYLALVKLGSSTVGPIVAESGISSSKAYDVLDRLIQRGLATYIIKEKTKYFQATQSQALVDYASTKEQQIKETKEEIINVLPEITAISQEHADEEARIFKGYKGIKEAIFEAIKTILEKGTYYFYSTGYGDDPRLQKLFTQLSKELKSRKITIKGLASIREKELFEKVYKKLGYKMRFSKYQWPSDITISGEYVLIFVWKEKEPVIYSLHSPHLVKSYLRFFQDIWKDLE
ncbi:MAG: TrmB family transcriptional regulator [Candidatus Nanoarchaeia archaeon]